jgi:hypothetical protein
MLYWQASSNTLGELATPIFLKKHWYVSVTVNASHWYVSFTDMASPQVTVPSGYNFVDILKFLC